MATMSAGLNRVGDGVDGDDEILDLGGIELGAGATFQIEDETPGGDGRTEIVEQPGGGGSVARAAAVDVGLNNGCYRAPLGEAGRNGLADDAGGAGIVFDNGRVVGVSPGLPPVGCLPIMGQLN